MKKFQDMLIRTNESPVGQVGRTKKEEAIAHIENSDVANRFRKIVQELGGKTVARELLAGMSPSARQIQEGKEPPQSYLRKVGYKIKDEDFTKKGIELEFFKDKDAKSAKEELESIGYGSQYSINVSGKFLELINI